MQRRRLALLSLLALAPGRAHSRDKLIGYLWREHETEQARRLLTVGVYELRRALGESAVLTRNDDLALDGIRIGVDVLEFQEACARGDLERAASLYAGSLLDGFFVADAPEFERWAAFERERLAQQFRSVLESLAAQRANAGDLAGAVAAWRRLAAEDPLNTRVAVGLMRALDAAGDRGGALRHAQVHAVLLREELGAKPDAEVEALAERLRTGPVTQPVAEPIGLAAPRAAEENARPPVPPSTLPSATATEAFRAAPRRSARRRLIGRRRARSVALLLLLIALGVGATSTAWQRRPATPELSSNRVAVLPFRVHGGAELDYLHEGVVDLLSANLDGAGELRSVDPRALLGFLRYLGSPAGDVRQAAAVAAHFGAELFVLGDIYMADGRLRMLAGLYRVGGEREPIARASTEGGMGEIFVMLDQLTSRLIADRLAGPAARLDRLATTTTHSLPALKHYLEGQRHLRGGRHREAIEALQQAVEEDSTFALAYYRLSVAEEWAGHTGAFASAQRAVRHGDRLGWRERMLLEALLAWRHGEVGRADSLYRMILTQSPEDIEARLQLGEVLFHYNPLRGRGVSESRDAWERVLAAEPENLFALVHLARLAAVENREDELAALDRRVAALVPPPHLQAIEVGLLNALGVGDRAREEALLALLRERDGEELMQPVSYVTSFSRNLAGAGRVAQLLTSPERDLQIRIRGHLLRAYLAAAGGRLRAAQQELGAAAQLDPTVALLHRALLAALPFVPATAEELRELAAAVAHLGDRAPEDYTGSYTSHPAFFPHLRSYLLGTLSARAVDPRTALRYAEALAEVEGETWITAWAADLSASLRAQAARQGGQRDEALQHIRHVRIGATPFNIARNSPFRARALERYMTAELLYEAGSSADAAAWFSSLAALSPMETVFLAPSHLRRAQLHEQAGSRSAARDHYASFIELWRDADGELQPLVDEARERLARLGGRRAGL